MNIEETKNKFHEIGYGYCKETKTCIEFRTSEYMPYHRIKISKKDFSITRDNRTGQGNRGHSNLTYKEFILIGELLKTYRRVAL
jgi:stress response protein SCP2